jgi:hypothetical protein
MTEEITGLWWEDLPPQHKEVKNMDHHAEIRKTIDRIIQKMKRCPTEDDYKEIIQRIAPLFPNVEFKTVGSDDISWRDRPKAPVSNVMPFRRKG